MFYMVSPARRLATGRLMTLVIVVALLGLVGHAMLDALPTWPATTAQTGAHRNSPTRSGVDRLATCAAHATCVATLPVSIVQLARLVVTFPLITLLFSQPSLPPPTAPPK